MILALKMFLKGNWIFLLIRIADLCCDQDKEPDPYPGGKNDPNPSRARCMFRTSEGKSDVCPAFDLRIKTGLNS